jgi:hypothetical protein
MADGSYGQKPTKQLSKKEAADLIKEARERLQASWEADKKNREEAALDLKFLAGDQWSDNVKRERQNEGRLMLTINRLPQFLRQVTNPIREADLSIKTAPVDSNSDPKTAKVFDGLLKQIEYQSSARAVYATCCEHQTGCGIGWARVCSDYVSDSTFEQELRIKAIPNPLAVYDDPGAVEPDRCDSNWRFITQMIPKADFAERWPKAAPEGVDHPSDGLEGLSWYDDDKIRVAEYWKKVPVEKTLVQLEDGQTVEADKLKQLEAQMGIKIPVARYRTVETHEIKQYLISGSEVLEGPFDWPGKYLPQVPFIGSEVPVESGTYRYSLIRFARDPQALYNYARTAAGESIALSPKAPYLVTARQVGKYQDQWATVNTKNRPYVLYEPDERAPGPPKREHPPEPPVALMNEALTAAEDMKGTTGIYDASLGGKSNETSGIAINQRQVQGDTATYHYQDNAQRSLEHLGRILIDVIPKIYDTERIIRILGEDDAEEFVEINKTIGMDPMSGQPIMLHDLSAARFDVRVRIGRSADSKRLETASAMLDFLKAFPEAAPFVGDLVAKNLDFPGAEQIAKRLRNMVPPQALADPDDPNAPQPPDPMSDPAMQAQMAELTAKVEKLMAEARKTTAEAEEQEFENALNMGAAQAGVHPMQTEARNAQLASDDQELSNTLNRDQAMRGQHEKQAPYAELARQLQEAKAAKQQGRVH